MPYVPAAKFKKYKVDASGMVACINLAYRDCMNDQHRYLVLWGGAGSGKSHFIAQKLIYRLMLTQGEKFLVVRKVGNTLRNSCYALLRRVIRQWNLSDLFVCRDSTLEIEYIGNGWGNSIILAGLDDVEKLKSIDGITSTWIEEATEIAEEDFTQLDLRLRGPCPTYRQILLSFNPISAGHWIKRRFFDTPQAGKIRTVHTVARDNAWSDEEYAQVLDGLKDRDEYMHTVYALGQWGAQEGIVLTEWDRKKHTAPRFPIPRHWRATMGIDYGVRNQAVQWWAMDERGRKWMLGALTSSGNGIPANVHAILDYERWLGTQWEGGKANIQRRVIDPHASQRGVSTGKQYIGEYREAGLHDLTYAKNINEDNRIALMRAALYPCWHDDLGEVVVFDDCLPAIDEFEHYIHKKPKPGMNEPGETEDHHDHHPDVFGYILAEWMTQAVEKKSMTETDALAALRTGNILRYLKQTGAHRSLSQ